MSHLIDWSTIDLANYSTSEEATDATWIDGKTIYKKTISLGALPNSSGKDVAHGISNLDTVVDFSGTGLRSTDNARFHLPSAPVANAGVSSSISVTVQPTIVQIYCGTDRSNITGYLTIWYTKTS